MEKISPPPFIETVETVETMEKISPNIQRADKILEKLKNTYPDARCELDFSSALELLVGTILAAQCTDVRVNSVTKTLFKRCKTASDYAEIPLEELEEIIRPTGFYKNKAKALKGMGEALIKKYPKSEDGTSPAGEIPSSITSTTITIEDISELPGAGRKTANVVLGNALGINAGFVVDTHVTRLSQRLGLSTEKTPLKIEKDLQELFQQKDWTLCANLLILHGRRRCTAKKPDCTHCEIHDLCPKVNMG